MVVVQEKVEVRCPACGEILQAVSQDGVVKGYCAKTGKRVEAQLVLH